MVQPFWIKKKDGKYVVVKGKEAVEESEKAREFTERKVGQLFAPMNMGSTFAGGAMEEGNLKGGVDAVKQLYRTGEAPSIGPEVAKKLGLSGLPAYGVGLALEVGFPEPSDIADLGKMRALQGLDDAAKANVSRLMNTPFSDKLLGDRLTDIQDIAKVANTDPKLARKFNSLLLEMQDKTNMTSDIIKKADNLIFEYEKMFPKNNKVLYHSSPDKIAGGKPNYDAYFGDAAFNKEFGSDFGNNTYKIKLNDDVARRTIDIESDMGKSTMVELALRKYPNDKQFAQELMAGSKRALEDFYSDIWTDKKQLTSFMEENGIPAMKFRGEYILSKGAIESSKALN